VGLHQMQWLPVVALAGAACGLQPRFVRVLLLAMAAAAPFVVYTLMQR
jgi:hypothetical protein